MSTDSRGNCDRDGVVSECGAIYHRVSGIRHQNLCKISLTQPYLSCYVTFLDYQEKILKHDIRSIAQHFQVQGDFVSTGPYGNGHINDTYAAIYNYQGSQVRYIHQRINHNIFKDPVSLMDNIFRVTMHQRKKLEKEGCRDLERRALTLVPTKDGLPYYQDVRGNTWRTYLFIEGARTYEAIENPVQAFHAAKAFGELQRQLVDLSGERLHETIPDFHNTPKRFESLEKVIEADPVNRAKYAKGEINFAMKYKDMTGILLKKHGEGLIPERITHNDTKLNNVMLDEESGEGICVIDLDTVMPGLVLYDFGDMVRTATSPTEEDERNLLKVRMEMVMFEALVKGYLESAGEFLNDAEKEYLTFSGKLITLEIGLRFLTDFLAGDVYFKVQRKSHNLDRCRTQFKLVESIVEQEDAMNRFVAMAIQQTR